MESEVVIIELIREEIQKRMGENVTKQQVLNVLTRNIIVEEIERMIHYDKMRPKVLNERKK